METHNYYVIAKKGDTTLFTTKEFSSIYGLTMKVNDFFFDLLCDIELQVFDGATKIGYYQETPTGLVAIDYKGKELR